ncbi:MAG: hypothetical protein JJ895_14090 [Balneolaceae bacterium]|nr:hypothetical protein [Balneolaceae bacterium]
MKKHSLLSLLVLLFSSSIAIAQTGSSGVQDRANDMFNELNTGELTLRFVNALTGEYIPDAMVMISNQSYRTDLNGKIRFKTDIDNGQLAVTFRKPGFINTEFNLEIMVGSVFQNQISISPDLLPEQYRIVLDWADRPKDLDAHFIKDGEYHISYRHKKTSDDGVTRLDRDDRNGNGPETITINRISNSVTYTYKVHDYTNRNKRRSSDLSNKSRATVRVYGDNRLIKTYRINANQRGDEWVVFKIENGSIVDIDSVN